MSMHPNVKKSVLLGGVAGALAMCAYTLLFMRFNPHGTYVPAISWLHEAISMFFSATSLTGALLGAATGYALTSPETGNQETATKVCFGTGAVAVIYNVALVLWSVYAGYRLVATNELLNSQFVSIFFVRMGAAALMTSLVFLWGLFLLALGFYLRRTMRQQAGTSPA